MNKIGLELFDLNVAAAWYRSGADRVKNLNKRQIVGLDLLFFREPSSVPARFADPATAAKAAAIAELYGFPDLALEIIDLSEPKGLAEAGSMNVLRNLVINCVPAAASLHD